ncbi:Uncharacterised protein [Vibrio cholerae]|nr:Uncharacterised protein [Vibrio cholerae]
MRFSASETRSPAASRQSRYALAPASISSPTVMRTLKGSLWFSGVNQCSACKSSLFCCSLKCSWLLVALSS